MNSQLSNRQTRHAGSASAIVAALAFVMQPATALAQNWKFEPVVQGSIEYNDNTLLAPDDDEAADSAIAVLDATGRIVHRGPANELRFDPRIRLRQFSDSNTEDAEDLFLNMLAQQKLERGDFGLELRLAREALLTAELDDPDFDNPDINDPVNLDTGRVRIQDERDRLSFTPFFNYDISPVLGWGIAAEYTDVSYQQSQNNLVDFESIGLSNEFLYRASDKATWAFEILASDYEAADIGAESQTIGLNVEYRYRFNATLEGRFGVGVEEIDSDLRTAGGLSESRSDTATLVQASITKTGQVSRLVLDLRQSVDPSGTGFLQQRAQARLRYNRQLTPRVSGNIEARLQNTEELSALVAQVERDFARLRLGLEWRLSRIWSVTGSYSFTRQDFSDLAGDATANTVSVGFIYNPTRRR